MILKMLDEHPGTVLLAAKNIRDDKVAKKYIANISCTRINVLLLYRLAVWVALYHTY